MVPALNFSLPAAELMRLGRISVPLFKCPDWPHVIEQALAVAPCYVHYDLQAGQGQLEQVSWQEVERCMTLVDTQRVNVHLSPSTPAEHFPLHEMVERALPDLCWLVQRFGRERVVLENAPTARILGGQKRTPLPALAVTQAVEAVGCGLLLDLSHALIAATRLGQSVYAYIESLPVQSLRELHVTGVGMVDGRLKDHLPMTEQDWSLFHWAMRAVHSGTWASPEVVALEYGGIGPKFAPWCDAEVIEREFRRVAAAVSLEDDQR